MATTTKSKAATVRCFFVNMTVFDCDFLHDDLDKVAKANVVATIVDGEEVYKA